MCLIFHVWNLFNVNRCTLSDFILLSLQVEVVLSIIKIQSFASVFPNKKCLIYILRVKNCYYCYYTVNTSSTNDKIQKSKV